mgnify:CR=1 FL=1
MSEIKLFEVGTVVKERTSSTVVLEKQLQTTIEQNMETFFGVRLSLHDALPISEEWTASELMKIIAQ